MARQFAKVEGVFAGMSTGGALACALKLAEEIHTGVIVFIACDRGDRYLSSNLFGE
jgi:cysteine synthase B